MFPLADPPLAVITGGSSGIGLELARLLGAAGFHLILVARDPVRLAHAAATLAPATAAGLETRAVDLADTAAVDTLCAELARLEVDLLVNNAGFGAYGPFSTGDAALGAAMIDTNVRALTVLTHAVLPGMIARGQGRILNVASTAAFAPGPFAAVYAASKAYVLSFSQALNEELRETRIRVIALCPGPTETAFAARAGMGDTRAFRGQQASAEAVALAGYQALLAGRAVEVVGAVNRLMIFAVRLLPRALVTRLSRRAYAAEDED